MLKNLLNFQLKQATLFDMKARKSGGKGSSASATSLKSPKKPKVYIQPPLVQRYVTLTTRITFKIRSLTCMYNVLFVGYYFRFLVITLWKECSKLKVRIKTEVWIDSYINYVRLKNPIHGKIFGILKPPTFNPQTHKHSRFPNRLQKAFQKDKESQSVNQLACKCARELSERQRKKLPTQL